MRLVHTFLRRGLCWAGPEWSVRSASLFMVPLLAVAPLLAGVVDSARGWAMAFFTLGALILVHELGHFLVAKLLGIHVETFAIGFGPRMIRLFKIGETEYIIAWAFFFGGYVKMAGGDLGEESQGDPREFLSRPPWHRILVLIAGPASNIVMAFTLYWIVYLAGALEPATLQTTLLGPVKPDGLGARAGLVEDDRIVAVQGKEVVDWKSLQMAILESDAKDLVLDVDHFGERRQIQVHRDNPRSIEGRQLGLEPTRRVIVGRTMEGSPAEKAGVAPMDVVMDANGQPIPSFDVLRKTVEDAGVGGAVALSVFRAGQTLSLTLQPESLPAEGGALKPMIGIDGLVERKYSLVPAAGAASKDVRDGVSQFVTVLSQLARFSLSPRAMSGPIAVVKMSKDVAQEGGAWAMLQFGAFISLQLGLFNLLPLFVIDGGLILLCIVEWVRHKSLTPSQRESYAKVSIWFLLTLVALISANDILNLFQKKGAGGE